MSDATPDRPVEPRFKARITDPNLARILGISELTVRPPGGESPIVIEAQLTQRQARNLFDGIEDKYPLLLTHEQAADLVQVSVSTLKSWLSEGRFAKCVRRGKPGRILRDDFLIEFMKDRYG